MPARVLPVSIAPRPRHDDKARGLPLILVYLGVFGFGGLCLYLAWQLIVMAYRWIA